MVTCCFGAGGTDFDDILNSEREDISKLFFCKLSDNTYFNLYSHVIFMGYQQLISCSVKAAIENMEANE